MKVACKSVVKIVAIIDLRIKDLANFFPSTNSHLHPRHRLYPSCTYRRHRLYPPLDRPRHGLLFLN